MILSADTIKSIGVRVQKLDADLSPGGLYAADLDLVFTKVLFPVLKQLGFRITFNRGGEYAYVAKKYQKKEYRLQLISISKFGSSETGMLSIGMCAMILAGTASGWSASCPSSGRRRPRKSQKFCC